MTSQKLNEEHEILRRFMAVVVSSAFRDSLTNAHFSRILSTLTEVLGRDIRANDPRIHPKNFLFGEFPCLISLGSKFLPFIFLKDKKL